MKVIDVLKLCECRVDVYYKGQYVNEYKDCKDLSDIEDWLLNSEVRSFYVNSDWDEYSYLEIDSE